MSSRPRGVRLPDREPAPAGPCYTDIAPARYTDGRQTFGDRLGWATIGSIAGRAYRRADAVVTQCRLPLTPPHRLADEEARSCLTCFGKNDERSISACRRALFGWGCVDAAPWFAWHWCGTVARYRMQAGGSVARPFRRGDQVFGTLSASTRRSGRFIGIAQTCSWSYGAGIGDIAILANFADGEAARQPFGALPSPSCWTRL
jgi:hypothetical protein